MCQIITVIFYPITGMTPELSETITLPLNKKVILFFKFANAMLVNWLFFSYTYQHYAVFFNFTQDLENADLPKHCVSDWGNYALPYQQCSIEDMFILNPKNLAHTIKNNSACLPNYLFGRSVRLSGYVYDAGTIGENFSQLKSPSLGFKAFTNAYLFFSLLPVLILIEKSSTHNKDQFAEKNIDIIQYTWTALLISLEYYISIECLTFGAINTVYAAEHCESLYSTDDRLDNIIIAGFLSLTLTSLMTIPMAFCNRKLAAYLARFSILLAGFISCMMMTISTPNAIPQLPKSLSFPTLSFFNGGISKIISIILAITQIGQIFWGANLSDYITLIKNLCHSNQIMPAYRYQNNFEADIEMAIIDTNLQFILKNEENISELQPIFSDFKTDLSHIFSQGYRFFLEKRNNNKLLISTIKHPLKTSNTQNSLQAMHEKISKKFSYFSQPPQALFFREQNRCIIKGDEDFIKKIHAELTLIGKQYQDKSGTILCRVS